MIEQHDRPADQATDQVDFDPDPMAERSCSRRPLQDDCQSASDFIVSVDRHPHHDVEHAQQRHRRVPPCTPRRSTSTAVPERRDRR